MATNRFSEFTKPGSVQVSKFRRIRHSISNNIRATNKGGKASATGNSAYSAAGYVSSGATIAAGSVPTASAGWGVAAGATAGTVILTVASGPVVASGLTLIALGLAAKSTYSNREKAHETLKGYVWTYIDDSKPKKPIDEEAKKAATSLVMDGKSQANILADKLKRREQDWSKFVSQFESLTYSHVYMANSFRRLNDLQKMEIANAVYKTHNEAMDLLEKALKSGGVGYEFLRRLVHAGNYVQAYRIFAKVMVADNSPLEDFGNDENAKKYRSEFARLSDLTKKVEDAGATAERFLKTGRA